VPGQTSYQWLGAEALAALLTSDTSFRRAMVAVRHSGGVLDPATRALADESERWIRPRARGVSLDALRRHRDYVWFGGEFAGERALDAILVAAADRVLDHRGSKIMLKNASAAEAGVWRALSLALPADLFIAALCARAGTDPPSDFVDVSGPHIRKLLDRHPSCDTHMHVSAGYSFPLLWSSLMPVLRSPTAAVYQIDGDAVPFGGQQACVTRLLQAAIARLVLAAFIRGRESFDRTLTLQGFLTSDNRAALAGICRNLTWPSGVADAQALILGACGDLATGRDPSATVAELRRLYGVLTVNVPPNAGHLPGALLSRDPLNGFFATRRPGESAETIFAARGLGYLREEPDDDVFAGLFWQYQRVRCRFFRYITHEPGTAGLDWFTQHFSRLRRLREAIEPALYHSALDLQSAGLRLGALEARATPGVTAMAVTREVQNFARQALERRVDGEERPEIGLVFHFIKNAERDNQHVGDPGLCGWRYGGWHADTRQRAMAIVKALQCRPELLMVLRGIDVANHELAVPLWTILPLLQDVRNASAVAAERMRVRAPGWSCDPISVTLHAGEDFRRLSEGLRRLHEPIEFDLLQPGDRIGHGVALGVDAESRSALESCLVQPREERLFDLLWELARYARGDFAPDTSRLEMVREEVGRLAHAIFDDHIPIEELMAMRDQLHRPDVLASIGYATPLGSTDNRWLMRYLTDARAFARAITPIEVRRHPTEIDMLMKAQKFLRNALGRLEITIESNPSSNLLIGDFGSLDEHPAFRIQPLPGCRADGQGSVLLSVNTDNPVTFATRLADEFAYLYYALIRNGVTADDALAWIDCRREDGWRSRFTLPASKREAILRIVAEPSAFRAAEMMAGDYP
jgi:hypothetical protein